MRFIWLHVPWLECCGWPMARRCGATWQTGSKAAPVGFLLTYFSGLGGFGFLSIFLCLSRNRLGRVAISCAGRLAISSEPGQGFRFSLLNGQTSKLKKLRCGAGVTNRLPTRTGPRRSPWAFSFSSSRAPSGRGYLLGRWAVTKSFDYRRGGAAGARGAWAAFEVFVSHPRETTTLVMVASIRGKPYSFFVPPFFLFFFLYLLLFTTEAEARVSETLRNGFHVCNRFQRQLKLL